MTPMPPIGGDHPSSGAYSPLSSSSWGSATWPLGANFTSGQGTTLDIGVYSANATAVLLEIYLADTGSNATYDYWMAKSPDNIWRAAIALVPGGTLYAFRAWGPNWPYNGSWSRGNSSAGYISDCDTNGNRFNPNKVLVDPYAHELSHEITGLALAAAGENNGIFGTGGVDVAATQTYSGPITGNITINRRNVDTGHYAPKSVAFVDATSFGTKPGINQKDSSVYETHLKGLTAHPSSANLTAILNGMAGFADVVNVPAAYLGTYLGASYMAGYLKDMGYTSIEFLPVQESDNETNPTTAPGGNYWGYMTNGFFAPDRHYAYNKAMGGPTAEFKSMVAAFHAAGLEVYMDVVYNHTGEGGLWDTTTAAASVFEFRGLDNISYYTLSGASNNYYYDSTGTGNNFNAGSAPARQLILDSLSYWSSSMGVDGFRFDLAVELGRNGSSAFSSSATTLMDIASFAAAQNVKVIAEPWDVNDGNEIGNFPAGWAEWNGNYRDSVRNFMIGTATTVNGVGYADGFYGDYSQFNAAGGPQKTVNMIDCHDGFVLSDLVSYAASTNASLLWPFGPSDGGTSSNISSAWGGNQANRRQVIRDFKTFQMLSRGIPMQVWGDEFGRTVDGNNNAYDVDSVATWNNYNMISSGTPDTVATGDLSGGTASYANNLGTFTGGLNENFLFLQYLLNLRNSHVAFRQSDYNMSISYTNPDGSSGFSETSSLTPMIYISGSQVGDNDFLFMVNMSGALSTFTVAAAPAGKTWVRLIDTANWAEAEANFWTASNAATISGTYGVENQSMVLLMAQ